ncbi:hypothetical protein PXH59_03445 [Xenorhabdus sp. SF857]|uniref:hypothetical protein n=1 Tax=Xenorhabdus bakwenae TaxID=3026967 RepID=UPI00255836B1|nr:hypothetical protein [Xenorhabdus sp. SF857]WFQ80235.1 hypothetical protein PXH59_03445 [Xenorhabdus sp. SF857]
MNNDVIELANRLKTAANVTKIDDVNEIKIDCDDLIKLCEAIEKLAEYENMKPVAIYNLADGEVYKSIHDIGDGKSVFAVNLYPHRNK